MVVAVGVTSQGGGSRKSEVTDEEFCECKVKQSKTSDLTDGKMIYWTNIEQLKKRKSSGEEVKAMTCCCTAPVVLYCKQTNNQHLMMIISGGCGDVTKCLH